MRQKLDISTGMERRDWPGSSLPQKHKSLGEVYVFVVSAYMFISITAKRSEAKWNGTESTYDTPIVRA